MLRGSWVSVAAKAICILQFAVFRVLSEELQNASCKLQIANRTRLQESKPMNWHQFRAILWLRWWIWFNQLKRGGKVQLVIMAFFLVIALLAGIGFFFAGFVI